MVEFPFLTYNETAKTLSSCYFLVSVDCFSKGLYYDSTLLFPIASYIVVVELILIVFNIVAARSVRMFPNLETGNRKRMFLTQLTLKMPIELELPAAV